MQSFEIKRGDKVVINGYFKTSKFGTLVDAELANIGGRYKVTKVSFPDMKEYIIQQEEVDEIQKDHPEMTFEDAVNEFYDRWMGGLLGNYVFDPNGKKDAPLINQKQPLIEKDCSLEHIGLYLESQGAKKLLVNLSGPLKDTGVIWEGVECVWSENGQVEGWMNEIGKKDTYVLKKNDFDTLPVFLIYHGNGQHANVDFNTLTDYVNGLADKKLPCNIWVDTHANRICLLTEVYVP